MTNLKTENVLKKPAKSIQNILSSIRAKETFTKTWTLETLVLEDGIWGLSATIASLCSENRGWNEPI